MEDPKTAEQTTRENIRTVWDLYCRNAPTPPPAPADAVSLMMHHASLILTTTRDDQAMNLAQIAVVAEPLVPGLDVLALSLEEYSRAVKKHPGMTLECDGHTDETRLFALVEEIGEVAACLTYDNEAETGHNSDLESEVIQVVALTLAWATRYLREGAR